MTLKRFAILFLIFVAALAVAYFSPNLGIFRSMVIVETNKPVMWNLSANGVPLTTLNQTVTYADKLISDLHINAFNDNATGTRLLIAYDRAFLRLDSVDTRLADFEKILKVDHNPFLGLIDVEMEQDADPPLTGEISIGKLAFTVIGRPTANSFALQILGNQSWLTIKSEFAHYGFGNGQDIQDIIDKNVGRVVPFADPVAAKFQIEGGASLYLEPSESSTEIDSEITYSLYADTDGKDISGVSFILDFDTSLFTVGNVSISPDFDVAIDPLEVIQPQAGMGTITYSGASIDSLDDSGRLLIATIPVTLLQEGDAGMTVRQAYLFEANTIPPYDILVMGSPYPDSNAVVAVTQAPAVPGDDDDDDDDDENGGAVPGPVVLEISPSNLSPATVDALYTAFLEVAGGTAPYSWSISQGQLPLGLQLTDRDKQQAQLMGVAGQVGQFIFTVRVEDSEQNTATTSFTLIVGHAAAPVVPPLQPNESQNLQSGSNQITDSLVGGTYYAPAGSTVNFTTTETGSFFAPDGQIYTQRVNVGNISEVTFVSQQNPKVSLTLAPGTVIYVNNSVDLEAFIMPKIVTAPANVASPAQLAIDANHVLEVGSNASEHIRVYPHAKLRLGYSQTPNQILYRTQTGPWKASGGQCPAGGAKPEVCFRYDIPNTVVEVETGVLSQFAPATISQVSPAAVGGGGGGGVAGGGGGGVAAPSPQTVPQTPATGCFPDTGNHAYETQICKVKALGIFQGHADGRFGVNDRIDRAQMATVLSRWIAGENAIQSSFDALTELRGSALFPDVAMSQWYAKYVLAARNIGLFSGYPDGSFRPSGNINYVEAIKVIVEAGARVSPQVKQALDEEIRLDAGSTREWYIKYVRTAQKTGILAGTPLNLLRDNPSGFASRAWIAYAIANIPGI